MVWLAAFMGLYLAILLVVSLLSLRPFRIPIFISPGALGAPQEEISFSAVDGTLLKGWWIEAPGARSVAVLAHGYVMNRAELAPVAYRLWQLGISSVLFDFRVHGRSGGKRSTLGFQERYDVAAAVSYARARVPGARIVTIGSSMGSAASALAQADDPTMADALVLDSCYSKLARASLGWWRFLGGPGLAFFLAPVVVIAAALTGMNPFRVDVAEALQKSGKIPVLFLHGDCDTLALPTEAIRNFQAALGPKELVWFEKCGHSEGRWLLPKLYEEKLVGFLRTNGFL